MAARGYRYTGEYKAQVWMGVIELPYLEEDVLENVLEVSLCEDMLHMWSIDGVEDSEWWPQFIEDDSL